MKYNYNGQMLNIDKEQVAMLKDDFEIEIIDGIPGYTTNGELEKNKQTKSHEARELIESHFKEHDQLNIIYDYIGEFNEIILTLEQKGLMTKGSKMKKSKEYIDSILTEYRDNLENADFSGITYVE